MKFVDTNNRGRVCLSLFYLKNSRWSFVSLNGPNHCFVAGLYNLKSNIFKWI